MFPKKPHFFSWALCLFCWVLLAVPMQLGCGGECYPSCVDGYRCQLGQCVLEEGGRVKAIRCEDYCARIDFCSPGKRESCEKTCIAFQDLVEGPEERRKFVVRRYECYITATCEEIESYGKGNKGFLRNCVGCLEDRDCPGGFRCNTREGLCRDQCLSPEECRKDAGYTCDFNTKTCK